MSSRNSKRLELIAMLGLAGRDLSAHTVMFHTAVAERMGLTATDAKAFDFIMRHGPVTAGQLAEITGLTTGAVTGVIDRLEKSRFVERQRDAADRRKVLVRSALDPAHARDLYKLFESLGQGVAKTAAAYSDRELAVILDFMKRSIELLHVETLKLRGEKEE